MYFEYNGLKNDIIKNIVPRMSFSEAINQKEITKKCNDERKLWCLRTIGPRRVRKVIEILIKEGYPIISTPHDPGGYCWNGGPGEGLECYKRLRRKGLKILLRARRVLRNIYRGQLSLFDAREIAKKT